MKHIFSIIILIGLFACKEHKPKIELVEAKNLSSEQIDSILTEYKFEYESPITLDSTNQVLIPISTELLDKRTKYSSDGYYSGDYPRYWNVLFYNRVTQENNLLTNKKIRISRIHANANEYEDRKNVMVNKVLYQIADIDYNLDNKLSNDDPDFLFISEIDGTNFKRISPQNEDLQYFEVISNSKEILVRTLRDTNQDLKFDRDDESIWYRLKLENEKWKSNELINPITRKEIEKLYFEQWLINK